MCVKLARRRTHTHAQYTQSDEFTRASNMGHTRQPVVNKDKGRDWLRVCKTGEVRDGTESWSGGGEAANAQLCILRKE